MFDIVVGASKGDQKFVADWHKVQPHPKPRSGRHHTMRFSIIENEFKQWCHVQKWQMTFHCQWNQIPLCGDVLSVCPLLLSLALLRSILSENSAIFACSKVKGNWWHESYVCVHESYFNYDKNHMNLKGMLSLQNGFWSMCLKTNITFMSSIFFLWQCNGHPFK